MTASVNLTTDIYCVSLNPDSLVNCNTVRSAVKRIIPHRLLTPLTFLHWLYFIHQVSRLGAAKHGHVVKEDFLYSTAYGKTQLKRLLDLIKVTFIIACEAVEEKLGIASENFSLDDKYVSIHWPEKSI